MLMQMLTETLLGALTGYMTNDTAIRSLFKPGGVIEKTRDDFAREAGQLLEDQVLTRAVLAKQLELPEVQKTLSHALDDFLQERLPQVMAQQRLGDLPDCSAIIQCLHTLLVQFLQQEREQVLLLLKKYLPADQILTAQQCGQLVHQLETILLDSFQQEAFLVRFGTGWSREHGQQSMEQLGLGDFCDAVLQNAATLSRKWPQQLKQQYGELLQQLLKETLQKIDLRPVLLELDGVMEQYTLQQYLNCNGAELSALLQEVLVSETGQTMISYIIVELLQALETVDVPAADVLPDGLLDVLTPVLQQQLPSVMERLLDWLRDNDASVNAMLEDAIGEIAAETGGMKGMLLEQLKETVMAQMMGESSMVDLLQQNILTAQTSSQAADMLMKKLQEQLTVQTLGELIRSLNEKQALEKLLRILLQDNLQRMLQQSGPIWMAALLAWKPGSLNLTAHQETIEAALADYMVRAIDQLDLPAVILQQRDAVRQATIAQLVPMQEDQLQVLQKQVVQQGCAYLSRALPNCSSDTLYRALYGALEQLLTRHGQQFLRQLAANYTVKDLLDWVQPWLHAEKPQLMQTLTQGGLDKLQGQLSHLAEAQIRRLSNEDMLQLVNDLMGRELKPLNYLGAAMGAVVGATVGTALSTALPVTAAVSPALLTSVLAGKSAVFGAVGYSTNCAAVKGLFWPYEPVGGVQALQGVIPKQKTRFAHSMGRMVDQYVINEAVLQELLQKLQLQQKAYSDALAADEQMMRLAAGEVAARRHGIAQTVLQWVQQDGARCCHAMLEQLGGMPFAVLRRTAFQDGQLEQHLFPLAEQWLNQQLHSDATLNRLVSPQLFWHTAQRLIAEQPLPDLEPWAATILQSENTVRQMLGETTWHNVQETIQKKLEPWLKQASRRKQMVETFCQVLSADRLQQWMEHNSSVWMEQNLSRLFSLVEQALLELLQSKQAELTTAVQKAILNRMGLMQQMGYAMMNGDAVVAQVVDRILQQKLPIFLSTKSRELRALFQSCWEEQLFPAIVQIPLHQQQIAHVLDQLLAQPVVHGSVSRIAEQAAQQCGNSAIAFWGQLLQWKPLLERIQIYLGFQWQRNAKAAIQTWKPLAEIVYNTYIGPLTLRQLTAGYPHCVPFQQLVQYGQLPDLLHTFQLRLQENLAVTRPQHWVDWAELMAVVDQAVPQLVQDTTFQQWLPYKGEVLVLQMTEHWQQLLPQQSRNCLLQQAMQAAFATANAYSVNLLQDMQLAKLAETQLIAMDSAHLERVVRSFASSYLVHIENRGWMGAVFALPGMLIYLF